METPVLLLVEEGLYYRATINDSFLFKMLYFPKYYTYRYD
jgi:hypothetical protein